MFNTIQSFEAAKIILIRYPGLSAAAPVASEFASPIESLYRSFDMRQFQDILDETEDMVILLIEDGTPIPKRMDGPASRILQSIVKYGHLRVMKTPLVQDPSLLEVPSQHFSWIHHAAKHTLKNKLACIKLPAKKGADIHAVDTGINTALYALYCIPRIPDRTLFASITDENGIVTKYFIEQGFDVRGRRGNQYLVRSLESGNDPSAAILIDAGADILEGGRGESVLHLAATRGCVGAFERLVQNDKETLDLLLSHPHGSTILHSAVRRRRRGQSNAGITGIKTTQK